MEYALLYIALACAFGLFMAWGIGANDVANAMGTSVGSGAVSIRQAILIAAVFEFAGAFLAGGEVTQTIRKGIIDLAGLDGDGDTLVLGMLASLLAAATWLLAATRFGWPVSTTHTIVGAIIGFALIAIGTQAVHWNKVSTIALSWVVSPLLSGGAAYLLYRSVRVLILDHSDPVAAARRYVPGYLFLVGFLVALVTLIKGLKHVGLELEPPQQYVIAVFFGVSLALAGSVVIQRLELIKDSVLNLHYANVERIFGVLMLVTACAMAFAHGSNDVANAVGPVATVVGVVQNGGGIVTESRLPAWILLLGAAGIVLGLITYGRRVIATVGEKITVLTPSSGFAATLAAAATVVIASGAGLPISTTHTLVGGVLGVGIAQSVRRVNFRLVRTIFISWIVTLPAGAVLAVVFFVVLKQLFT